MPIYEYVCGSCHSEFELLVRGDEQPACPQCSSRRLEKQWSVPAAHAADGGDLPVCDLPSRGGSCGLPACQAGGCQFE